MDKNIGEMITALVASALFGRELTKDQKLSFFDENSKTLLEVSKKHDVIHLVAKALVDNGLVGKEHPLFEVCKKAQFMAVYRYEQLKFELDKLCEVLESAAIPFIPLKGSVLRAFYPEPWMRTSCDIDVLVKADDLEKAIACLAEKCGYTEGERGSKDVVLCTPGGLHIELHFSLISERRANKAREILTDVWDYAKPLEGFKFWHVLSDDIFYFYHIAHMASHFEGGGCGIRPFVDLWVLDNLPDADKTKREELLEKGMLLKFAKGASALSRVWMQNEEHDALSAYMEQYLLYGGAYGTYDNMVAVQQNKKGGKFAYTISRIFPDAQFMGIHFTYVKKYRWLLPFAYVHRAFVILFRGNAAKSLRELKANSDVTDDKAAVTRQMLEDLGLLEE